MSKTRSTVQRMSLYDPFQLDEESFKQTFIARQYEVNRLLRHIYEACGKNSVAVHTVIYGEKGMGKTALLRRLAIAVNEDAELEKQWIPLCFREEQYNVATVAQLWKNCVDSLAEWCEVKGYIDTANHLDDLMASYSNCDDLATVKDVCKEHKRRFVLLIDNLDLILNNLSEQEQWQLRDVLQEKDAPLLIASVSTSPERLFLQHPFFSEFFRVLQLQPLHESEVMDCLECIARRRSQQGKKVLREIDENPERVKVLYRFCGDTPRTLMIIYQALEIMSTMAWEETFCYLLYEILGNFTSLYHCRTNELAPQQRQVLDAIALHWHPISLAAIACRTELKKSSVSSQLKRLETNGIIEVSGSYQGRSLYQLTERSYNIWYLMRYGLRHHKRNVFSLSDFLIGYYAQQEIVSPARPQQDRHVFNLKQTLLHRKTAKDNTTKKTLKKQIRGQIFNILGKDDFGKDLSKAADTEVLTFTEVKQKLEKNITRVVSNQKATSTFAYLICGSFSLQREEKQRIADMELSFLQREELQKIFNEEKEGFMQIMGEEDFFIFYAALCYGFISTPLHIKEIMAASLGNDPRLLDIAIRHFWSDIQEQLLAESEFYDDLQEALHQERITKVIAASSWTRLGGFYHGYLKEYQLSKEAYLRALHIDEKNADAWSGLGNLYHYQVKNYQAAKDAYLQALRVNENHVASWYELGNLCQNHLHDYKRSKSAYLKAISVDGNYAPPWNGLGNLYHYQLKDYQIAKEAYFQAIDIDGNYACPWGGLGDLYIFHLRDVQRAKEAYIKAISLDAKDAVSWNELATLYRSYFQDYPAAKDAYLKAIAIDEKYVLAWNGLGSLYQDQLKNYSAAKDAYMQALAADPKCLAAKDNLVWLGLVTNDERLVAEYLFTVERENPGIALLEAALSLRKNNVGDALEMLKSVLEENNSMLWIRYRDDLLRLLALFYTSGFYTHLLTFFQKNHFDKTLAPLFFAIETVNEGSSYLQTLAPEMRPEVKNLYWSLKSLLGDIE